MHTHEFGELRGVRVDRPLGITIRQSLAACALLALLASPGVAATLVRVMPLGDSITAGDGNGGYRGPLYQMLTTSTSTIDFVGSVISGTLPDRNNEGHSGWRADQIRDSLPAWLTAANPNIILLHIGTNDINQGEQATTVAAEIGQILDLVDAYETSNQTPVTVILGRIVNRSNPFDAQGLETTALNVLIGSMAATRIAAGDRLIVVDHESALTYPNDMVDTLHPNASGYQKMATVWYAALYPLLRNRGEFVSDTLPRAMIPGTAYPCSVTMHNSGYEAWLCSPAGTMLTVGQTVGPMPNKLIPYPYLEIYPSPCQIDVGQDYTFPFTITVPSDTPLGQYEVTWQMKDIGEWFDSLGHEAVFRKTVAVRLYPFYKGDLDDDGDVDQEDFGRFQACFSGVYIPQNDPGCALARLDDDSDVDTQDLTIFRKCVSGADVRPDPSCISK